LAHGDTVPLQRAVIHNATAPDRAVAPTPHQGLVVGYIGSPRRYKDVETLFAVARALSPEISVVVVGATEDDAAMAAHAQSMGVRVLNAVPYAEVPALLAGLDVAILPLGQDLYSRELASPLKLWDYLAAGLRVVAADTPAIRRFPGEAITTYRPGSVQSMAEAIQTALERPRPTPLVRTWDDRAAEIEDFLEALA
jgi:glycosyltransferase involved in cell wall biosynthesis